MGECLGMSERFSKITSSGRWLCIIHADADFNFSYKDNCYIAFQLLLDELLDEVSVKTNDKH